MNPNVGGVIKGIGMASVAVVVFSGCDIPAKLMREAKAVAEARDQKPPENITIEEKAEAQSIRAVSDPVGEEIERYRLATRQDYNARHFDALEENAAHVREESATFGNGSWKIVQFYDSLGCGDDEPDSMWQLHDEIHRQWISAKPESITAQVAYAEFLTDYAWQARGSGYADTVSAKAGQLFDERLAQSAEVLQKASQFSQKDPNWARAAMTVALGQGWSTEDYDALVDAATAEEPKFWSYDNARAYSLLPRWYGEPGDWEAYAEKAATRPGGLGAEAYARIVLHLASYYDNIFEETKVDWKKTREGLDLMIEHYPQSLALRQQAARLAVFAHDREYAQAAFEAIGDDIVTDVWRTPERFVHYRNWARTGQW